MSNRKYEVYKTVERTTASNRANEARVLNEAALRLERCQLNWNEEGAPEEMIEALKYNQRIWTILQCAIVSPDCPLPEPTRMNMLRLSAFIDRQIFKAMASPAPELLQPIIEINQGLAKGLSAKPKQTIRPILVKT